MRQTRNYPKWAKSGHHKWATPEHHKHQQAIVNKVAFEEFLDRCEQAPDITDVHIAEVSLASFDQLFSGAEVLQ